VAKADYESRTEKLLDPIIKEHQFELVDVEWVKEACTYYLRVYVDKEGGITIDD
jgi:ribosome maturation factor RimP